MAEVNCNSGKEPKTLEIPPSCSAKRDIKVQTPLPEGQLFFYANRHQISKNEIK